jgi:hypothetical protein
MKALLEQFNVKDTTAADLKNKTVDSKSLALQNEDMTTNSRSIEEYRNKIANGG